MSTELNDSIYKNKKSSEASLSDCRVYQAFYQSENREHLQAQCRCPKSCPMDQAMLIFGGKWNVKVLFALFTFHTMRFGEIQRYVDGISKTMLSSTLKFLETNGLVSRRQLNEIPPHVEYSLTDSGQAMKSVFIEIGKWSAQYLNDSP